MENKKIYYGKRIKPTVLENNTFKGYEYFIITMGTHPCCYVLLPEGHKYHSIKHDEIPYRCHGGLTYSKSEFLKDTVHNGEWVIGWDYAHLGDYISRETPSEGHKWSFSELKKETEEFIANIYMDKVIDLLDDLISLMKLRKIIEERIEK